MSESPTVPTEDIQVMPTEAAFLKQAELAQLALYNFLEVAKLGAPDIIPLALKKVLAAVVRSHFYLFASGLKSETLY